MTRDFPVEFPYKTSDAYYLNMQVPPRFALDSTPAPVLITLDDGIIQYRKSVAYYPEIHTITSNAVLKNKQTVYDRAYYDVLRNFYEGVIKEENKVLELQKK